MKTPHGGVFSWRVCERLGFLSMGFVMKFLKWLAGASICVFVLPGCTLLAIADAAGSAVVYGVKTTVNVLDAVTPDIVNKK
jgi:hypothetical protein